MKIVFATSEVVPFAKTGGLADVCGTLPIELEKLGHEVVVFVPAYRAIWQSQQTIDITPVKFSISIGKKPVEGGLLRSTLPNSNVIVYLVDQPAYFDRPALYGQANEDYLDNCERFTFFCRAVLESIGALKLQPDGNFQRRPEDPSRAGALSRNPATRMTPFDTRRISSFFTTAIAIFPKPAYTAAE